MPVLCQPSSEKISIDLTVFNGRRVVFCVCTSSTINQLVTLCMDSLIDKEDIAYGHRLFFECEGHELPEGTRTLSDYNIQDEAELHLRQVVDVVAHGPGLPLTLSPRELQALCLKQMQELEKQRIETASLRGMVRELRVEIEDTKLEAEATSASVRAAHKRISTECIQSYVR